MYLKMHRWLNPPGGLFYLRTKETRATNLRLIRFLGEELYYSHKTPQDLYKDLINAGFKIVSADYRAIGGETFLWVTVKPD